MSQPLPRIARPRQRIALILGAVLIVLFFSRSICSAVIDYLWWRELGQVNTWVLMSVYRYVPGLAAWLLLFLLLCVAHARGVQKAGERLRDYPWYFRITTLAFAFVSFIIALAAVDGWTVARFFGGHGLAVANEWHDPVFNQPLGFYFFDLPFYNMLIDFIAVFALAGAAAYYLAARGWQIRRGFPGFGSGSQIDFGDLRSLGRLESGVLKILITIFLVTLAGSFWLGRYDMLLSDHGNLMVGIDYVQQNIGLPMQYAKAGAAILAAILVLMGQRRLAVACALVLVVDWVLPPLVSSLYVKPNELTLERPFLKRHIEATREGYGLDRNARETDFAAQTEGKIDFVRNKPLLDNVRLWDWHAFHDTLGQIQPLRPYMFADTDVDRYKIGGQMRQILLAPRELDPSLMGESWINRSLSFTHGYGFALAEANRITPEGLPVLLVKDAPIEVDAPGLKVTRPQIYYGETSHEPVFVRTSQKEFDYPAEPEPVRIRYDGRGGFPMSAPGIRTVAAISEGDSNIFLTNTLTPESRMMIRRRIPERLGTLAEFISWDSDPYLVITDAGKLVWIVDGYVTSDAHPYSRDVTVDGLGRFNYIRNSIKATVDAYDGDVHMYVFDDQDPLIGAYRHLFPDLFEPSSAMPADLRTHARAPETLFRTQAEMYRTYHMRDPEAYYNRADLWDLATFTQAQGSQPATVPPTYMIAVVPGETSPEFLLTVPFTPRNKQNLIGLMVARCDGPHLGELVFLDLPKQEIIRGPIQVEAVINQDQTISKDLTLWNQQGSQVLRSQILALPIDQTFLYVAPIYIQASQARMPQLKKVALVVGNTLAYADTYELALTQLAAEMGQVVAKPVNQPPGTPPPAAPVTADSRMDDIRQHLKRYHDFAAQGKWSDAGKELEAIEAAAKK